MEKNLLIIVFSFLFCMSLQGQVLKVVASNYGLDEDKKLILIRIPLTSSSINAIELNGSIYVLDSIISPSTELRYTVKSNTLEYALYFTNLPIIKMKVDSEILDEPKIIGTFSYADADQSFSSYVGVELRGGFSQTLAKKTYDLEFYEDPFGEDNVDFQFGNLRSDDDWILDAVYNEPLRITSYLSHKLWLDIHTPHYIEEEEDAKAGAEGMFVELFLGNNYNGLYLLLEQVDRKLLQLEKGDDELSGALYKGDSFSGTQFKYLLDYEEEVEEWSGYSLSYPKLGEVEEPWLPLYDLIDKVVNEEDEVFDADINTYVSRDNMLDYFLFINVIRALDNTGKNIYLSRQKEGGLFFYTPWDLDGTFGFYYNGTRDHVFKGILENDLISRIARTPESKSYLRARWASLRSSLFAKASLIEKAHNIYTQLYDGLIYEREALAWTDYIHDPEDLPYMSNWIVERINYLDHYLDIILNVNQQEDSVGFSFGPNPSQNEILVDLDKPFDYKILSLSGQLIREQRKFKGAINIEDLMPGLYVLMINGDAVKFIKQ